MSSFWERVSNCEHKNISDTYSEYFSCLTPYCNGTEEHCLDCGAYITKCGCNYNTGVDGWPKKRRGF